MRRHKIHLNLLTLTKIWHTLPSQGQPNGFFLAYETVNDPAKFVANFFLTYWRPNSHISVQDQGHTKQGKDVCWAKQ